MHWDMNSQKGFCLAQKVPPSEAMTSFAPSVASFMGISAECFAQSWGFQPERLRVEMRWKEAYRTETKKLYCC